MTSTSGRAGKLVLVTGGSRGIGAAIVRRLAASRRDYAAARTVGLPDAVIAALRAGEPHADLSVGERAAHAFANELVRSHSVADKTYRVALECF